MFKLSYSSIHLQQVNYQLPLTFPTPLRSLRYSLKYKWFEITHNASNSTIGNSLCKLRQKIFQGVEKSTETTAYSHCSAHGKNTVHHICKKWGGEEEMQSKKPSYVLHHWSYKVFLTAVKPVCWTNFCQNYFWHPKISCPTVLWEHRWAWATRRYSAFLLNADRLVFDSLHALVYQHIDICWT